MSAVRPVTERRYEDPFVRQFSIFLPNRVGVLSEMLDWLSAEEVELAGISILDSAESSIVRAIFTNPGKGRELLTRRGLAFAECDAIALVLEEPMSFQKALKALLAAEVSVNFVYPLLIQSNDHPVMLMHTDDTVLASHVLIKHGFGLLNRNV
jgi:hypothetical protein